MKKLFSTLAIVAISASIVSAQEVAPVSTPKKPKSVKANQTAKANSKKEATVEAQQTTENELTSKVNSLKEEGLKKANSKKAKQQQEHIEVKAQ